MPLRLATMQDRITNDGRLVTGSLQPAADTWERAPHVPLTAPAVPPITNEVDSLMVDIPATQNCKIHMHDMSSTAAELATLL